MTETVARYVRDMPEDEYFAHPALSQSQLKRILDSPKHFRYATRRDSKEFDMGHAIHARVLGTGMPVREIPAEILGSNGAANTTKAREFIKEARAEGAVPLKASDVETVKRAADAVLTHPNAKRYLDLAGDSEVSLFGADPVTGVALRGRLDRVVGTQIIDLKSMADISDRGLSKSVASYCYDMQGALYRMLLSQVTGEPSEPVVLIATEKDHPYDVRVVTLSGRWVDGGEAKLRRALDLYDRCSTADEWPGIDDGDVMELPVPGWYEYGDVFAGDVFA